MRPSGHRLTSGSLPFWASSQEALLQATALWPRTWDGVRPCFVDLSELSECLPIIAIRCGHNLQVEGPLQFLAAFFAAFFALAVVAASFVFLEMLELICRPMFCQARPRVKPRARLTGTGNTF